MRWQNLPPLSALRAFAAFAQTGNVVAAGEALGVSHAAISQQLRALEKHMDLALLDRTGRQLRLTEAGHTLALALEKGFAGIIEASESLTGARDDRPLHISTTPTFAASWLMPRLPGFRSKRPDIDLTIDPSADLVTLSADGADMAIRYGRGPWAGLESEMLLRSPMVVIAAPTLVGEGPLPALDHLGTFPWLEEFGTTESTNWLGAHGALRNREGGLMQVPGNLLLDGVRDGQGLAVTVRAFVERDIAAGRLRILHQEEAEDKGYQIVTRPGPLRPALKAFVAWLRRQKQV